MTESETQLMDSRSAAKVLGLKSHYTLNNWRCAGIGPAYIKVGRAIRYRSADLEQWVTKQRINPIGLEENLKNAY